MMSEVSETSDVDGVGIADIALFWRPRYARQFFLQLTTHDD